MKLSAIEIGKIFPNLKFNTKGTDLQGECPFCKENTFGISTTKEGNPWACYRAKCGSRGKIKSLLSRLGILSDYLVEQNYTSKQIQVIERALAQVEEVDLEAPDTRIPLSFQRIYKDDYLEERGFISFAKYEVGIALLDSRLGKNYRVFLIRMNGAIKGFVGRHVWSKQKIDSLNKKYKEQGVDKTILRYRNDAMAEFGKLLLGYDEIDEKTETVIVVEGLFDKESIDRKLELDNQSEIKCVCSFGASLSLEQTRLLQLKGVQNIILMYESDVLEKNKKTAIELKEEFKSVLIAHLPKDKDPADLSLEELDLALTKLETPSEYKRNKLQFSFK